jgi:hypothetical protein
MAVYQVYAGDWRAAHAEARAFHDALTGDDWRWFDPQALDLAIQLREGAPKIELDPFGDHAGFRQTIASDHAALRWGVASDDIIDTFEYYSYGTLAPAQVAVRAAAHGDAGPLADVVERSNGSWRIAAPAMLAVLPQLTRDRERLVGALRWLEAPVVYELFDYLHWLALRRDVARLAGDAAAASRCQAILDRYRGMLADREKAIALVLMDDLRPRY